MATVAPHTPPTRNLEDAHRRLRSPLARLRGYIRTYVGLEGVGVLLLFLILWFWLGIFLDFGFFKLTAVDWVQVMPLWLRVAGLVVVVLALVGLVGYTIFTRLFREFRDAQLALVLERRFPKQLGDRLITAVELSDPKKAAEQGYSRPMVEQTIHDASERVEQVPVHQVFDWGRLVKGGLKMIALAVVLFVLIGFTFTIVSSFRGKKFDVGRGFSNFRDVASIWFERNILLEPTPWPRAAQMEIIEPVEEHKRISPDAEAPVVRIRAFVYLTSVPNSELKTWPTGWRPLRWSDVGKYLGTVPDLPADWEPRDVKLGMTVDEVALRLEKFPISNEEGKWLRPSGEDKVPLRWEDLKNPSFRGSTQLPTLSGEWDPSAVPAFATSATGASALLGPIPALSGIQFGPYHVNLTVDHVVHRLKDTAFANASAAPAVKEVLARLQTYLELKGRLADLDQKIDDPNMARTLRKLDLPPQVKVLSWNENRTTQNSKDVDRGVDNEYITTFDGLKVDTISYFARGEDFTTETRSITVLAPPTLSKFWIGQERPAYLYYPPDDSADPSLGVGIRGRKQVFNEVDQAGYAGDVIRLDKVPAGTNVIFRGLADRPLKSVHIEPDKGADTRGLVEQGAQRVIPARMAATLGLAATGGASLYTAAALTAKHSLDSLKRIEVGAQWPEKMLATLGMTTAGNGSLYTAAILTAVNSEDAPNRFEFAFKDVRNELRFILYFIDTDGIKSSRRIQIRPLDDQPPELNEVKPHPAIRFVDTEKAYMVTVDARLPFLGKVTDDHGLTNVGYAYTMDKVETGIAVSTDALALIAAAAGQGGLDVGGWNVLANAAAAFEARKVILPSVNLGKGVTRLTMPSFREQLAKQERLPRLTIEELLSQPQGDPTVYRADKLLKAFEIKSDRWEVANPAEGGPRDKLEYDFPLYSLDLKAKQGQLQQRYRMLLWVEATDTDVESEKERDGRPRPHTATSKDRYPFIIVSENELLVQIGKQEEKIAIKLDGVLSELIKLQARMDQMNNDLQLQQITPTNLEGQLARLEEFDTGLDKGLSTTMAEAVVPYRLIAEEMHINQVDPRRLGIRKKIEETVIDPLEQLVDPDKGNFKMTAEALALLRQELNKGKSLKEGDPALEKQVQAVRTALSRARKEMSALIVTLNKVLGSMQGIIDIKKLIQALRELEAAEKQETDKIRKAKKDLEDAILGGK
jgi:hypothetical protein